LRWKETAAMGPRDACCEVWITRFALWGLSGACYASATFQRRSQWQQTHIRTTMPILIPITITIMDRVYRRDGSSFLP